MARTLDLPCEVKADQATAKLSDGVLEVRVPKSDQARASNVKVKASSRGRRGRAAPPRM